jgi:Zn-dependent protease/CBS domain-containing protein
MKNALYIGSVSGIKIFIHWTFLILIGWIVFSNLNRGLGGGEILWAILFILTIFACVTLHELGHALAAKKFNIKTRDITLLPIGGVAQMESIPEKPQEELIVAVAGPAVNFVIFILLFFALPRPTSPEMEQIQNIGPANFMYALMIVNMWLALFNLIPAFPMDGGRVFRALLAFRMDRTRATRIAANLGQLLAMAFIFLGLFYNPFLVFIGLFIFIGAQAEAQQTETQSLLRGYTVRDALLEEIPGIEADATVRNAADQLLHSQNKYFVVNNAGKPEGTLGRDEIIKALREVGDQTPVRQAMRKDVLYLSPTMPIEDAWKMMQQQDQPFALVTSKGEVVGALDTDNIAEFVMIRSAEQSKKGK